MGNPYEVTSDLRSDQVRRRLPPFLIGARKGFLWSLLLAVPASFAFYSESILSMANPIDPITLSRMRIPITDSLRISACMQAITAATLYIVLPWAGFAGCVSHVRSKRQHRTNGEFNDTNEIPERPF